MFKHLTYSDRNKIEALVKARASKAYIASYLGVHISTIYRELRRGWYERMDSDLRLYSSYSCDIAQKDYLYKQASKGSMLKIGRDYHFARYVENKVLKDRYSPDAIVEEIKAKALYFETSVCTKTLYNYIHRGIFLNISEKNLLRKGRRRKITSQWRAERRKMPLARCIDERPEKVNERVEFGHWEMDTVKGKAGTPACLLVLTERKTRYEIIRHMQNGTQEEVGKALDKLEKSHKSFDRVFKTITCDNGVEFLNSSIVERSCKRGGKVRTFLYYCHPYSSYERGSNENANSIIRRMIPKGTDISKFSRKYIAGVEAWMNNYPRRILSYKSSAEAFQEELQKIFR